MLRTTVAVVLLGLAVGVHAFWPHADGLEERVFNILDFGAVGDGRSNDTAAIQSAIHAASSSGGGRVLCPSGGTYLSGSLFLEDNVDFYIDEEATLLGSPTYTDYPFIFPFASVSTTGYIRASLLNAGYCTNVTELGEPRPSIIAGTTRLRQRGANTRELLALPVSERLALMSGAGPMTCLEWRKVENVSITGSGTIDGSGWAWWYAFGPANLRSDMVQPAWVRNLLIRDVSLVRSPSWTVHLLLDENVLVSNVTIDAGVFYDDNEYDGHNVDGVDPESSLNVTIEHSAIRSGDDCVAVYSMAPFQGTRDVVVRNVTCHTPLSVTHGLNTSGVLFENCTVLGAWGGDVVYRPRWWHTAMRIKTQPGMNYSISNVEYRGIVADGVDLVFEVEGFYSCQNSSGMPNYQLCCDDEIATAAPDTYPVVRNVSWRGITATNAWRAAWLGGNQFSPSTELVMEDILISGLGGQDPNPFLCEYSHGISANVVPDPGTCLSGGPYPPTQ
jgi:polygalacturonase